MMFDSRHNKRAYLLFVSLQMNHLWLRCEKDVSWFCLAMSPSMELCVRMQCQGEKTSHQTDSLLMWNGRKIGNQKNSFFTSFVWFESEMDNRENLFFFFFFSFTTPFHTIIFSLSGCLQLPFTLSFFYFHSVTVNFAIM